MNSAAQKAKDNRYKSEYTFLMVWCGVSGESKRSPRLNGSSTSLARVSSYEEQIELERQQVRVGGSDEGDFIRGCKTSYAPLWS